MLSFSLIAFTISSALSVPLDGSKTNFNSNPFIILAQSAESAGPVQHDFTTESVQIVTSASVKKETKDPLIERKTNKKQKLKAEELESKNAEKLSQDTAILDTSHWKVLSSFNLSSSLSVVKYRSAKTGLTIVLARAESPIVNGYFCLATEAMTNDGLPHTLEHLVFLGSEDYPYKEVLDLLANRCLADRTNAWTDTDHTCYTVYTAGPSGFLQILPVYMDHILYPTLREEDYLTEVHHINGEGQDAGVVYSEMQGVEHSSANILYFELAQRLYPNSGYKVETGGYLRNLRNSTNIAKVRDYHKKYYRPENLVLTITGRIDEQELFERLRKTEEKVLRKRAEQELESFERPWQTPLEKINLTEDLVFEIEYPSDDETTGSVVAAWRLPEYISENIEMLEAYKLIMKYLTSTQVSPFEVAFVETRDPLATSVSSDTLEIKEPSLLIQFENVPIDKIDEVIPKMEKLLRKIVSDGPENFDLERISNFIDRVVINNLKEMENSPHLFLPDASVLDMLYGEKPEHLRKFVTQSQLNQKFLNKNATFWLKIIDDVFINSFKVVVKGKPSMKKVQELTENEEERVQQQIKELGPEGLKEKGDEIENAIESQELPGKAVLEKIPLGDVDTIKFRPFESYNRTHNPNALFNFTNIPFKMHIENVNSNFVEFYIFLNTEVLTIRQKMLLPLLLDLWLQSPIKKSGVITDIEKVVKRRTKTLLHIDNSLGFSGSTFSPGAYGDALIIEAQAERKKFAKAINFLSDAINYPHLTTLKVNTTAANILNNIPSLRLSATDVLRSLHDGLYFSNQSNIHHTSFLRQKAFLDGLLEEIKTDSQSVIAELYGMINTLARPKNAFVYLATDADELVKHFGSGLPLLNALFNVSAEPDQTGLSERFVLKSEHEYRKVAEDAVPRHVAFGVGGTESCYLKQSMLYNNTDWTHKEVADIRVMLQYLSDRMYDEVRGPGLTYGVSMSASVTEGRLTLSLTRSSRLSEAYKTVQEILRRYIENEDEWDQTFTDSAKGSIIYSWAEKEETVEDLVGQTVKAYMRGTDSKYNRQFVRALGRVNLSDIQAAAKRILPEFLYEKSTQTVIVCNPASIENIVEDFRELGIELKSYGSLEDTFLVDGSVTDFI
jgi:Zn-dependent M16 (insulinase) family peptidase